MATSKKKRVSKPKTRKKRVSKVPKPKKRTSRKPAAVRPAAPAAPVGKTSIDFDDMDAVREEMARALSVPADRLEIEEWPHSISNTKMYQVEHKGVMGDYGRAEDREYYVVENDDAVEEEALARVKQDLENEPEIFNQSFIESHLDEEKLRRELESDVQNSNEERLRDERASDFWREAESYGVSPKYIATGITPAGAQVNIGTYDDESDADTAAEQWMENAKAEDAENADEYDTDVEQDDPSDSDIEAVAEAITAAELKDPMQYLEDIYGKEDAVKQAIQIAGIDVNAAAQEAVNVDGAGHFLASYDGDLRESPNGLAYWRHN